MNRLYHYRWISAFFGLGDKYRETLWSEIFELAYNSNGGFTHDEIYFMPTPKRRFYVEMLIHKKKEEEKNINKNKNISSPLPKPPNIRKH